MSDETVLHVLIVDDEPEIRAILAAVASEAGFRVSCAKDAEEARTVIDEGDLIDVVVIDVVMPGELGASLAEHVHSLGVPIILISGNPQAMQHEVFENIPCVRLGKPFHRDAVIAALRTAVQAAGATPA